MVDGSFVGVCVLLLDVCNGTSNDVFWRKKNNLLASRLGFGPFWVHMFIDTGRRNFIRRDQKKNTSHKGDRGGMFSKLEGNLLF